MTTTVTDPATRLEDALSGLRVLGSQIEMLHSYYHQTCALSNQREMPVETAWALNAVEDQVNDALGMLIGRGHPPTIELDAAAV